MTDEYEFIPLLEKQEQEEEEWWEGQDQDESWIQEKLRHMKEEMKRWI